MKTAYQDEQVIVEVNSSGEVFISSPNAKKTQVRVSPQWDGEMIITCYEGQLTPSSINGLSAIRAIPKTSILNKH